MKELSIQIKVYPVSNMRQDVYRFMADEFEFTPVPESSEAGRCFTDTRHRSFRIGDKKIPAIVSISPNLNSATLKIECKMLSSPLL